ncbi:hypothetical protein LJC59_08715, partial [Desulfovibrio sp. OttesenSCG-928-A18]|nr:hypothetical protein [Desulfovibrio sp. OttesenSCG-928-A18]
ELSIENQPFKGALPVIIGTAKLPPRVKGIRAEKFKDRAPMIHAGGNNYSDGPEILGGGGARTACGILK